MGRVRAIVAGAGALALVAACSTEPPPLLAERALDPPRPIAPAPGPTGRGALRPRLAWTGVAGADRYEVALTPCAGGVADCDLDAAAVRAIALEPAWAPAAELPGAAQPGGRRFAWRVRACAGADDRACSPWSRPRWLDVGRAPVDLDGDGYSDAVAGAPLADLGGRDRGAVLIARGPRLAAARLDEPAGADGAEFGAALAAADVDGDGKDDLLVGAPGHGDGAGRAYVYARAIAAGPGGASGGSPTGAGPGGSGGPRPTLALAAPGGRPGDAFGAAIAAGDFDGDGYLDVAIAAPGADGAHADADVGRVLVWRGGAAGLDPAAPRAVFAPSPEPWDRFGASLAAGDVDGDGYADLIVGAPGLDRAGARRGVDRGAVYVFRGSGDGLLAIATRLEAPVPLDHDRFGFALAAGDLDGDGRADLLVGAPSADGDAPDAGLVYVFRGDAGGVRATPDQVLTDAAAPARGAPAGPRGGDDYQRFGSALALVGDVDGDGHADAVIGTSAPGRGLALFYRGTAEGLAAAPAAQLSDPDDASGAADDFGASVAGAGDVDGDGHADVLVGAASARRDGQRQGSILVYRGSRAGLAQPPSRIDGPAEQAHFGRALAGR